MICEIYWICNNCKSTTINHRPPSSDQRPSQRKEPTSHQHTEANLSNKIALTAYDRISIVVILMEWYVESAEMVTEV